MRDFRWPPNALPDGFEPLSFQQESLWFLQALDPQNRSYHEASVYRLSGALDARRLEQAFNAVADRHHILRTVYPEQDGAAFQHVLPQARIDVACCIPVGAEEEGRREAAMKLIHAEGARAFRLESEPPIRVGLFELGLDCHLLHVAMHHIATDGWSWSILMREVMAAYAVSLDGSRAGPPPLALQYADYARRQRAAAADGALEPALAYWTGRLDGAPILHLPVDHKRPTLQAHRGAGVRIALPRSLRDRSKAAARAHRTTLFVVLLSAFKALLARLSGMNDIVVGVPVAGRNAQELESMIGFFVNTIASRAVLTDEETFSELVTGVRDQWLQSIEHQDLPFEKLVEALRPGPDLSRNPIFPVMFAFQNAPTFEARACGLNPERLHIEPTASRFDLELSLEESSAGLEGWLIYDTDLFERASALRMAAQYERLLDAATADPSRPIRSFPMVDASEHRRLEIWNATDAEYPHRTLNELFERQAQRTPSRVAIEHGEKTLTFAALNERANRLAAYLRRAGVGPDTIVAVHLDRSPELIVAALAVLKAGGVYMPLQTDLPLQRRRLMIEDSGAKVVITEERADGDLTGPGVTCIDLARCAEAIALESAADAPAATAPDSAAYVIYTSGSTGVPNGVVGLNRGMVNRLTWMQRRYPMGADDVCCLKTRIGFVDSIAEMFGPLLQGVRLVLIDDADALDPRRFIDILEHHRVTRLVLTPSHLRTLLEIPSDLSGRAPALKLWSASGEALTPDIVRRFHQCVPGRTLLNLYGSTEVSADVTAAEISDPDAITIGRPIDNCRIHVLDKQLEPAPIGAPGDIFVGGDGLARGYLRRPELNRRRFLPDPFSGEPGARLFKTGDRGRYRADGAIEILGRSDSQIKLRGIRIDLGEIEHEMRNAPGVADAAVIPLPDAAAPEQLIAFYRSLVDEGGPQSPQPLLRWLQSRLPAPLVPARLIPLAAFPQTATGKTDRMALARAAASAPPPSAAEPASVPQGELLRRLKEVWCETLGLDRIEAGQSFFDLGGHSLLAARLMVRIEQTFGVRLPLTALFEAPTAAGLAARLNAHAGASTAFLLAPAHADGQVAPLFCLHGLFLYRALAIELGDAVATYGIYVEEELDGLKEADGALKRLTTHYLAKIRSVCPNGPYRLAGLSRGGLIAFEIARQLRQVGERVDLVALLDANAPGEVAQSRLALRANLSRGLAPLLRLLPRNSRNGSDGPLNDAATVRLYEEAFRHYRPKSLEGDVVVFRAEVSAWGARPNDLGWQRYVRGEVIVHEVPGDHLGILRPPHVAALAAKLKAHLAPRSASI